MEGNLESYLAAVGVLDAVTRYDGPTTPSSRPDSASTGSRGSVRLGSVPAVDITEAAAMLACLVGRSYSVVTTLDRTVP